MTWSRMKFEGWGSGDEFGPASFAVLMFFVFYMGRTDSHGDGARKSHPNVAKDATLGWGTRRLSTTIVIICVEMAKCVQCGRQLPALSFGKKLCQWCVQHEAAQRGEDSPIQRVEAAPWRRSQSSSMAVTQAIFGINVAVFIGMTLAGASPMEPTSAQLVHWGANYGPYPVAGEWWRLLTCVFVHIGIVHIALNMWCLWSLGRIAEAVYDHWTFGAVYLITGVSASVASLIWSLDRVSAGASGAIFGIAGALIASFYLGEFS